MVPRTARFLIVLSAAAALWRCGSGPASPSDGGVKLQGVVLEDAVATAASASVAQSVKAGKITVTVQESPSLSTTVSSNGTFAIQGLPAAGFTLLFSVSGAPAGAVTITAVGEGTTVKIVVKVREQEVELVDLETEGSGGPSTGGPGTGDGGPSTGGGTPNACMIDGAKMGGRVELEGSVEAGTSAQFMMRVNGNRSTGLVNVAANAASYKCYGNKTTDCKASLRPGAKVHVRGTLTSCATAGANVTATEVKIQKD
jgi:hypothetical protein